MTSESIASEAGQHSLNEMDWLSSLFGSSGGVRGQKHRQWGVVGELSRDHFSLSCGLETVTGWRLEWDGMTLQPFFLSSHKPRSLVWWGRWCINKNLVCSWCLWFDLINNISEMSGLLELLFLEEYQNFGISEFLTLDWQCLDFWISEFRVLGMIVSEFLRFSITEV